MSGIITYGSFIPMFRITADEIAQAHGKDPENIKRGLLLREKAVASADEDTVTLALSAAIYALESVSISSADIGAMFIGSESHPYAVKPSGTLVGQALGMRDYFSADLEFACKAGTAAMQIVASMVRSNMIAYGFAVGADTAQGAPGDMLEYTAASGAAAFLFGNKKDEIICEMKDTFSMASDTPDFWRAPKSEYPAHGGRFTGEPAYFEHVVSATKKILKKNGKSVSDFDHVIFHMPNGKFPQMAAKTLGVSEKQLRAGMIVSEIGNTYSACSMLGLANVLDHAKAGESILMTSYGSGSGSDSFIFEVTKNIENFKRNHTLQEQIREKKYVSYPQYVKMRGKLSR
ncbi:MAG: hydroxymethylglutaryl-CoA synthase [Parcubacteria group bacterium]|nr:hydroxymethylglutaryl-CoA synthase [Parcubacteria group bacterium]